MAGQRMRCPKCRERFTRSQGSSRVNCETCSPPRGRGKPALVAELPTAEPLVGRLEAATLAELAGVDRQESAAGALALHLARQLDVGLNTGSQAASLARELRASIASAIDGATPVGDTLDELQTKRRERLERGA